MNKKLKIALICLLLLLGVAYSAWKYVNKPSADYVNDKIDISMSCEEIMVKAFTDSASSNKFIAKLVAVDGLVKKVTKDSASVTVELGSASSPSSVICQIDQRHQDDFSSVKIGDKISIKGKISACAADDGLGLGSTIQMNYCSLNK